VDFLKKMWYNKLCSKSTTNPQQLAQ